MCQFWLKYRFYCFQLSINMYNWFSFWLLFRNLDWPHKGWTFFLSNNIKTVLPLELHSRSPLTQIRGRLAARLVKLNIQHNRFDINLEFFLIESLEHYCQWLDLVFWYYSCNFKPCKLFLKSPMLHYFLDEPLVTLICHLFK